MRNALVLLSGGQDSTTCLKWALDRYEEVETIGFFYDQKHSVENKVARNIANKMGVNFELIDLRFISKVFESNLISGSGSVNLKHKHNKTLPSSFVPNRNALFLTIAHAYAQKKGIRNIIIGVSEEDYSGYPDCRLDFIQSIERSLSLGSETLISIVTPLIYLSKKEIFKLAEQLEILPLILEETITCYNGDISFNHWGKGCGKCPACELRMKGFYQYIGK